MPDNITTGQPVATLPNYIGQGQYLAFENYFACRDERESKWRLSRITYIDNGLMQFTYIGEFPSRGSVIGYITK